VRALGTPLYPESPSNLGAYPGFSLGGTDQSFYEFAPIPAPVYFIPSIENIGLSLQSIPSHLGPGYVNQFGFGFQIDPTNPFWTSMQLILNVLTVDNPNVLMIQSPSGSIPGATVNIAEPGTYIIPLGDFTSNGINGNIIMVPMGDMLISLDSWGFRSNFVPPPLITVWYGEVSSDWNDPLNWSDGVPGPNHAVIILATPNPPVIVSDVIVKSMSVSEGASIITTPGVIVTVIGGGN
jgi:hypothetical protein